MSKKLIFLTSFVLVLALALTSTANADDPNLVGWWRFDGDFTDSSGNGNHGELGNGVSIILDPARGQVASFDGVDDYVEVSPLPLSHNTNTNTFTNTYTITTWIKRDGNQNDWTGIVFWRDPKIVSVAVGLNFRADTNQLGYHYRLDGDATTSKWVSDLIPPNGEWAFAAVVVEPDKATLYLDEVAKINTFSHELLDNVLLSVLTIGWDRWNGNVTRFFRGLLDDVLIFDKALTQEEIVQIMKGEFKISAPALASNPSPADEATDVPRDVVLGWTPGEYAPPINGHKVYLSENFDNVNDGIGVIGTQDANSHDPGRLDLSTTYYWRVDEANSVSGWDRGNVWQFTVEPIGYQVPGTSITATASSSFSAAEGPENTVNGSGLDADDLHSAGFTHMWFSGSEPLGAWIQYEFDKVYKLHQMWVWNSNKPVESPVGLGLRDVTIKYSVNGTDWIELGGVPEFAQAPGAAGYAHNTTVDLGGAAAKYVKITANSNWGGLLPQYGLSEVRFFSIPVQAREPDPEPGTTDVSIGTIDEPIDVTLGFRAGREAVEHDVYLSTDEQAVIDGTAPATTVTEPSYGPLSLDLGQTYYWRVDEVNEAETPASWQGDIWNFATQEYFVLDDFESYDDYEPNRIFDTWTDGWGVATNGATMGYPDPVFMLGEHFVETTIVHSGSQSAPLFYDNTAGAAYSEATRNVGTRDWTQAGVEALTLWFYGDPNNSVTEQMYVKLNGSKVAYDGDAADIKQASWKQWTIDLASLGVDLRNVTKLAIGFGDETNLTPGGSGVMYFDDIRLYPLREPEADLAGN